MKKCTCLYKAGCGRTLGVLSPWVAPGGGGLETHTFVPLSPYLLREPSRPARLERGTSRFPSSFLQELSAGSQLEEDSTVLIDPFSWRYHFLKQS